MSRSLFLREVRRQAVPAAALLALGLLLVAGFALFAGQFRFQGLRGYALVPLLMAALGPYLLGVAAVAPDVESGGEAFLSRLPLRRGPLLLLRAAVAAGWSGVVLLSTLLVDWTALGGMGSEDAPQLLALGVTSLTFGLLASVALRYTLLAFLLGPALVGIPAALYELGLEQLGLRWDGLALPAAVGLVAVAATTAWTYLRGDLHAPGWRPLRLSAGLLLAVVPIGLLATQAAWAVSWRVGEETALHEAARRADGEAVALAFRTSYYSRAGLGLTPVGESGAHWLLVSGERAIALEQALAVYLSPDGERVLRVSRDRKPITRSLILTCLETRGGAVTASTMGDGQVVEHIVTPDDDVLGGERRGVTWVGSEPWVLVSAPGRHYLVRVAQGGQWVPVPGWLRVRDVQGPWVLASSYRLSPEWAVLDLRRPEAGFVEVPGPGLAATQARLVSSLLVTLEDGPAETALRWVDLEGRVPAGRLPLPGLRPPPPGRMRLAGSDERSVEAWPDGSEALIVSWGETPGDPSPRSHICRVDLTSGRTVDLNPRLAGARPRPLGQGWLAAHQVVGPDRRVAWSLVATAPQRAERHELGHLPAAPLALLGDETSAELLLSDGSVVDMRSGAPRGDVLAASR